jgi:N-acetylmuramoyl-L-alanine amidase
LISLPCRLCAQNEGTFTLKTVVIDAGHGGHDPGTISSDGKVKEKNINLDVALKLGAKIKEGYPGVKVIYTRSKDVFIPLAERADIANRNQADLFISIHVNSVKGSSKANGIETFVMGTDKSESNMAVCRRENSVILLEDDYSTTYQGFDPNEPESYIFFSLMQNANMEQSIAMATLVDDNLSLGPIKHSRGVKQAPLLVLWRTTMPSLLIEIGFLSNNSDKQVLTDASKRDEIASRIYKAFSQFKEHYDFGTEVSSGVVVNKPVVSEAPAKNDSPKVVDNFPEKGYYTVQIFASKNRVPAGSPDFKGEKNCNCRQEGGFFKYSVGKFKSRSEASQALTDLKKRFPGAFVTYID